MKKTLYLINEVGNFSLKNKDVYFFCDIIPGYKSCFNDAKRLNKIGLENIKKYSDFVYSKLDLFNKKNLIFEGDLSLYSLSTFSNKRSEVYDTYDFCINLLLINDIIIQNGFKEIICVGFEKNKKFSIESFFKSINLIFIMTKTDKPKTPLVLSHINFYFFAFIKLLIISFFNFKKKKLLNKLFFTRFPLHFDNQSLSENKYGNFYNRVEDCFALFLISDNIHQKLNVFKYIKCLFFLKNHSINSKSNFIIIDKYLSFNDLIHGFTYFFKIRKPFKKLKNHNFIFANINISHILEDEFRFSLLHIPRIILYKNPIKKIFKFHQPKKNYYHLFEYNIGRFLSYLTKKYTKNSVSVGFQHGPVSKRKLLNCLSDNEGSNDYNDFLTKTPIPDKILCEDIQSYNSYKFFGYNNIEIMNSIPRLHYLSHIKRNKVVKNTILIACGLHDTKVLYNYLLKSKLYKKNKIYFKLHPRSKYFNNHDFIMKHENIIISKKPINKYLSFVSKVFSVYSSVGFEAYALGIESFVILSSVNVNQSNLLDYAYTPKIKFLYEN